MHGSEAFTLVKSQPAGVFAGAGAVDGVRRRIAYRAVGAYPLIVMVGMAENEIFSEFESTKRQYYLLGVGLSLLLGVVLAVGVHQRLKLNSSNRALALERDRAESASRAKSSFLAVMSHEIRTPMNAVLGLCSSLLERPLPEEDLKVVQAIHESGDGLLEILNDILDYSKLESGRLDFESLSFPIRDVVETTLSIAAPRAMGKGLAIEATYDPGLPAAIVGDAGRIRQVLLNLISNAVKFTGAGKVSVTIQSAPDADGKVKVEWSVSDTGIGIAPDKIDLLFNDYVQADNTINRRFGGSGLGLSICKRIIDQMGGSISVNSTLGEGTTVRFNVPFAIASPAHSNEEARNDTVAEFKDYLSTLGRPLRVLIVDDNSTNRLVAAKMLQEFAPQVSMAGDGVEAVTAAGKFSYDIILMDMRMPEMDGLEAAQAIRAKASPYGTIPIIALTANAYPEDIRACLNSGMNDFVAKPVRKHMLIAALMRALGSGTAAKTASTALAVSPEQTELCEQFLSANPAFVSEIYNALASELGCEAMDEAYDAFIAETAERLQVLTLAAIEADRITISREAHTLKGTAATFGFGRMSEVAKFLEKTAGSIPVAEYHRTRELLASSFELGRSQRSNALAMAA